MQTAHQEEAYNHSKEINVVMLANTIIQPSTVMIKTVHASVTLATVLR